MIRIAIVITLAIGMGACGESGEERQDAGSPQTAPDLIIHNAKILTVDQGFSIAEAAAVKDGAFVAAGRSGQRADKRPFDLLVNRWFLLHHAGRQFAGRLHERGIIQ